MSPEMKTLRRVGKSDIQIIGRSNIRNLAPAAPVILSRQAKDQVLTKNLLDASLHSTGHAEGFGERP
jgi:hypothetical protein